MPREMDNHNERTLMNDISAFDRFVERWYAEGGQIITEEVQALYDASQASEQ